MKKVEKDEVDDAASTGGAKKDEDDSDDDDDDGNNDRETDDVDVRDVRYKLENLNHNDLVSRSLNVLFYLLDWIGYDWVGDLLHHLRTAFALKDRKLRIRNVTWVFSPEPLISALVDFGKLLVANFSIP